MKKILVFWAVFIAVVSCRSQGRIAIMAGSSKMLALSKGVGSLKYEGVLPEGDALGVKYELYLKGDVEKIFSLKLTTLKEEGEATEPVVYTGKVEVRTEDGETYYILEMGEDPVTTFLVVDDVTLRLVGELKAEGLNYDLKLVQ